MKSFKYTFVFILLANVFSGSFAFTPYRIEPLDIRAEGMGDAYLTDSESFYTLFSNPAGLAFAGQKTLFPSILSTSMTFGYVEDSNHSVSAPLTFGAIKNNFGWGVLNTVFYDSAATAIDTDSAAMNIGTDLALVFGYSLPLDLGVLGKLSIGFSGRGIVQARTDYTLLFHLIFGSISYSSAENTTLGFGFDVGIQYEVLGFIDIAVVLQDAYTAVWTKNSLNAGDNSYENPFTYEQLEPKLAIGIGFDIPLEKITEAISHLGIHIDYNNLWPLFKNDGNYRNPLFELSVGAELVLFDVFAIRLGMHELYPTVGLGLKFGNFRIDFSLYGRDLDERNLDSESWPPSRMNAGLSLTVQF